MSYILNQDSNPTEENLKYYKQRAIQINTKDQSGTIPQESLRSSLGGFGAVWDIHFLRIKDHERVSGSPNTAIVIFRAQSGATKTLRSSREEIEGSFWRTDSITACPLIKTGPVNHAFITMVVPRLRRQSQVKPSRSDTPQGIPKIQRTSRGLDDQGPPSKRPRTENLRKVADATATKRGSGPPTSEPCASLDTPEWMRARIAQLEAELDSVNAAHDMAVSEQAVIRSAHQAEQRARREAMSQKSAAEAALARKDVEERRLRSDLESALAQKLAAEDKLKIAESSLGGFAKSNERIKGLELELRVTRDRAHALQMQKSSLESQEASSDSTKLDDAKAKIKELKSRVKQLKSDLTSTQDQLATTQGSLESVELERSSTYEKYKGAKAKLGVYKERLENERASMKRLRDTVTPATYESLDATRETLGALLSALNSPPVSEDG